MPSFDIVSRVELQEVDNAVNNVTKELQTRYDFRNVTTEINLNRKDNQITVTTGDEMKYRAIRELLITHCVRRKVDPKGPWTSANPNPRQRDRCAAWCASRKA